MAELETRLRNIFEQRQDKTMFIAAAGTLRYGEIVAVIDAAKGAGVEKVGIVTDGSAAPQECRPGIKRETNNERHKRPLGGIRAAFFF